MTVELLTLTSDPGLIDDVESAPALTRLFARHGVTVRARRVVAFANGEAERALRQAVEAGGLVVCVAEADGAAAARQALTHVLGARLVLSDAALTAVAAGYARQDRAVPRRAEALALVPQGAELLVPPGGGEPGLLLDAGGALLALLPADAALAVALASRHLLPRLAPRPTDDVTIAHTLRLVGRAPGEVAAAVRAALAGSPATAGPAVEADGEVRVSVRVRGATAAAAEAAFTRLEPALRQALGADWYGVDDERMEAVVGGLLRAGHLTIALAESCTGGLIASRLTDVAGSSRYFERGLVVYSNGAKQALLGIPAALLLRHGAVSAECVEAMARGVRAHAGTDLGVAVTGVAGPDGGSPAKPVGTVFIGLADSRTATVQRHRFHGDRERNKALSALMALDLVRRACLARR